MDNAAALAALPRRLRQHGIAEADEPPDDADAACVHLANDVVEVVDLLHGADATAERYLRVEPDNPGLVLEVDLDRVDPPLVDQLHDATAQVGIRPAVERDVHRAHGHGRPTRDDLDGDAAAGAVSRRIDGFEEQRRRQRRRDADGEATVLDDHRTAGDA